MFKHTLITAALGLLLAAPATAQQQQSPPAAAAESPYAPYDWLIGDWSSKSGLRELISYGPNRSYIKFSAFIATKSNPQRLHFEGIALWNARTRRLDYLFAVEPGSGIQENGTYRVEADGEIIREVELIDATGKSGTFRQTFRRTGTNSAITTVMRQTATGWEPTFPGGERIELSRRPG